MSEKSSSLKSVLSKISGKDSQNLTENDKEVLTHLIKALEKAQKLEPLGDTETALIKELISKSRTGTISPADFVNFARVVMQVIEFWKDST